MRYKLKNKQISSPNISKHQGICKMNTNKQFVSVININSSNSNNSNASVRSNDSLQIEKEGEPTFDDLEGIQNREEVDDIEEMKIEERGLLVSYNNSEPKLPTAETEYGRNIGAAMTHAEILPILTVSANNSNSGVKEVSIGNEVSFYPANKDEKNKIIGATRKLLGGSKEQAKKRGKVSKCYEKCKKLVDVVQYRLKTNNMNNLEPLLKDNIKKFFTGDELYRSLGTEIPKIKTGNEPSNQFFAIKASFSALEAQEYEDLKAKPHEDIIAYMDNLDVDINTKERELQQLKNFKICANEVLRQKNSTVQAIDYVNAQMLAVLQDKIKENSASNMLIEI
jgi:hypothetical protein